MTIKEGMKIGHIGIGKSFQNDEILVHKLPNPVVPQELHREVLKFTTPELVNKREEYIFPGDREPHWFQDTVLVRDQITKALSQQVFPGVRIGIFFQEDKAS